MSNYTFYLVLLSEAALFVIFLLTAYWYAISVNVLTPIFKTDGNYVSLITLLLVWSSFTLPNLKSDRFTSSILITIALGIMFLYIQLCEYRYIGYTIATSSVYSAFYTLTGLHIIHVILGIVLLVLALATPTAFSTDLYFKYWHFVDIIWVILYLTVY
jgi:heme/copper-type cytochrome/quinol oxidase subunit 3